MEGLVFLNRTEYISRSDKVDDIEDSYGKKTCSGICHEDKICDKNNKPR